jgi:hypothetical protein
MKKIESQTAAGQQINPRGTLTRIYAERRTEKKGIIKKRPPKTEIDLMGPLTREAFEKLSLEKSGKKE